MKHPALTRVFAIVLAVLCLVMLLAGLLGLRSASRDRRRALDAAQRLQDRVAAYREASAAVRSGPGYEEQNAAWQARQAEHDKAASRHRSEVAIYTATQSGLRSGAAALDQADALMAEGRRQYEAGLAEFETRSAAFDEQYWRFLQGASQLSDLRFLYDAVMTALYNARAEAANARVMGVLIDSDDPADRRALTLDAYDGALAAVDQAEALFITVKTVTPTLDAIAAMDLDELSALTEPGAFEGFEGLGELGDLSGAGIELPELPEMPEVDAGQLRELKAAYDEAWPRIKALIGEIDRMIPVLDSEAQNATGMSLEELRAAAGAERDAIAAGEGELPLTDEEFEAVQTAYSQRAAEINGFLDAVDAALDGVQGPAEEAGLLLDAMEGMFDQLYALMDQAIAAIGQGRAMLEEAGNQLAMGEQALYDSRAVIWQQMGQQREKAAALREEQKRLVAEARELKAEQEAAEARRELEQQERSLRLMLLNRDEIAARVELGMALEEAAALTAAEQRQQAGAEWRNRLGANVLLIAGAVFGLAGLPAAFEQLRSRFMLITPVLLCLLCAAGAEAVFLRMGRGHSYSALAGALFALLQLCTVIPKKRK